MAQGVVKAKPIKQTHPTSWAFLSSLPIYKFEVILAL